MKLKSFEELRVWKSSIALIKRIYDLSSTGKFASDFGLRDQVRRSTVSIASNIAEGFEKYNNVEFVRFLKIAKGSAGESRNHIVVAHQVGYITLFERNEIMQQLDSISRQIASFIVYLKKNTKLYNPRTH